MKLVEMKCEKCGAILEVEDDAKSVTCKYCHTTFAIDDEVKHIQYDNMFDSGYEFEKGRIKAQNEECEEQEDNDKKAKKGWRILRNSMLFIVAIAIIFSLFLLGIVLKYFAQTMGLDKLIYSNF